MRLIVQGRAPLTGTYHPAGNSNEAITLIAASLLSRDAATLKNMPNTTAVQRMIEQATEFGAECAWQHGTLHIRAEKIAARFAKGNHLERHVAKILLLAPMLAHRGHAVLEWRDPLGRLHTHLTALRDLNVKIEYHNNTLNLKAQPWQQAELVLTETSVTATALICMLAAVMGEKTIVHNAASEPHLRSLQKMLVQMGAVIEGLGSNLLTIYGKPEGLNGANASIQPDHIETASIAAISAITPGHVTIDPVHANDLQIISKVYERLGVHLIFEDNHLHVHEQGKLMPSRRLEDVDVAIDTAPWPGFPSDLVALTTVIATQADGTTLIHEKLFNNRLLFVDKLKAMGAQIVLCDPHRAVVIGPTPLRAEYLDTPDVRIGLALLGAALCAEGQVIIDRAEVIQRNFENVIPKLIQLGAQIEIEEG